MSEKEWWEQKLPWYKLLFHPMMLTLFRFCASPFVSAYIVMGETMDAGVLFFIATLTDLADGYLARRWGLASERGKVRDSNADKVLHWPQFFLFLIWLPPLPHYFLYREIPMKFWFWILLVVFLLYTSFEALLALSRTKVLKECRKDGDDGAKWMGKYKTWAQSIGVLCFITGMAFAAETFPGGRASKLFVTVAQIAVVPVVVLGFLSLRSRVHLDKLPMVIVKRVREIWLRLRPAKESR